MAGFVQIIEFDTSRPDEVEALSEEFRHEREASDDATGVAPLRVTWTADRDHPGHFVSIVEFTSYEEAMENSKRPETGAFAARMAELCDGPPRFLNLDISQTFAPRT